MNSLNLTRGHFAQVCVEIDLTHLVKGKVWIREHWYHLEYEGLHIIYACQVCVLRPCLEGVLARNL